MPQEALDARVAEFRRREESLEAVIESLRNENAQHRAQLAQQTANSRQQTESPRVYTRAQLDTLVERGDITEAQRDAYMAQQETRQREETVRQTVAGEYAAQQRANDTKQAIGRYVAAHPSLMQAGSEERNRVTKVYTELVGRGYADGADTELLALEREFGPVSEIQERTRDTRRTDSPAGGADASGDDDAGGGDSGAPKDMNATTRELYEVQIAKGRYSGWDDPALLKEWEYAGKRQKRAR